jgi:hypothetical protein
VNTLHHAELCCHEFGRLALLVPDLRRWVGEDYAALPLTIPRIEGFDCIQIEALLAAIQRGAVQVIEGMRPWAAIELAMPLTADHRLLEELKEGCEATAKWLISASTAADWRLKIRDAISRGRLCPVDMMTGLPAQTSTEQGSETSIDWTARIARFKELGGSYAGQRGAWTFTGWRPYIAELLDQRAPKRDPKTLKAGFKNELDNRAAVQGISQPATPWVQSTSKSPSPSRSNVRRSRS